jgi:hypothetical protein
MRGNSHRLQFPPVCRRARYPFCAGVARFINYGDASRRSLATCARWYALSLVSRSPSFTSRRYLPTTVTPTAASLIAKQTANFPAFRSHAMKDNLPGVPDITAGHSVVGVISEIVGVMCLVFGGGALLLSLPGGLSILSSAIYLIGLGMAFLIGGSVLGVLSRLRQEVALLRADLRGRVAEPPAAPNGAPPPREKFFTD